jgi:hypothetical protein
MTLYANMVMIDGGYVCGICKKEIDEEKEEKCSEHIIFSYVMSTFIPPS